jgi:hypothetical protein
VELDAAQLGLDINGVAGCEPHFIWSAVFTCLCNQ